MPRELHYKYYKMAKCSDVPSYYKRFTTGNGENLPCVGCYQLPFLVTLLVVARFTILIHFEKSKVLLNNRCELYKTFGR